MEKDKIGDLPTWIGAIGTVGALIGTIWLATNQERQRRKEQRIKAEILSPVMVATLHEIQAFLSGALVVLAAWELDENKSLEAWRGAISAVRATLEKTMYISDDNLQNIAVIVPDVAAEIHYAQGQIRTMTKLAASASVGLRGWKSNCEKLEKGCVRVKKIVDHAIDALDELIPTLVKARIDAVTE